MGEIAQRATNIVSRAVGNTVAPLVQAAMTMAAVVTKNPELAVFGVPAGAFAGSMTEEAGHLIRKAYEDRQEQVAQLFHEAEEAGLIADDLMAAATADRKVRRLLAEGVSSAADASDEWVIRALARAVVQGAKDDARIDEMRYLMDIVRDLEVPDARLLGAIARFHESRSVRTHINPEQAIVHEAPLRPVISVLLPRLATKKLVAVGGPQEVALTDLGWFCYYQLVAIQAMPQAAQ